MTSVILVDTSAWVEHLRGTRSATARSLSAHIERGSELLTTDAVVMELLAGADTPAREQALERLVAGLRTLPTDPPLDFRDAAQIYRAARRGGRTVRSLVDCLIAAVALRHGVPILHRDSDYDVIAEVTGLHASRG